MALLDDTGDFVNREEYYPFGETSFGSYAKKRYKYQGKERDSESGLYYFGARYYSAWTGRFVSVDAVVQPGQSSYCGMNNNPISTIDPDGNLGIGPPAQSATKAPGSTTGTKNKEFTKPELPTPGSGYILNEYNVRGYTSIIAKNAQIDWAALREQYTPDPPIKIKDYSSSEKHVNSWGETFLNALFTMAESVVQPPMEAIGEADKGNYAPLTSMLIHNVEIVNSPGPTMAKDMTYWVLNWYKETGDAIESGDVNKERELRMIGALTVLMYTFGVKGAFKGGTPPIAPLITKTRGPIVGGGARFRVFRK